MHLQLIYVFYIFVSTYKQCILIIQIRMRMSTQRHIFVAAFARSLNLVQSGECARQIEDQQRRVLWAQQTRRRCDFGEHCDRVFHI